MNKILLLLSKILGLILAIFTIIGVLGLASSFVSSKPVLTMKITGYGFTTETTTGFIGCLIVTICLFGLAKIFFSYIPEKLAKNRTIN